MVDKVKGALLGVVDGLNRLEPFDEFTRAPCQVDRTPLANKAAFYAREITKRFMHGPQREFYWSTDPNDLGDMAIWQGVYAAACAFAGDWPAYDKALAGMERLQKLGGNDRLARGVDGRSGAFAENPTRVYHIDGDYVFVDDCSESSLIGHVFGLWAGIRFAGQGSHRRDTARMLAVDLARQVTVDGYRLLNQDGGAAKFGDLRPGAFTAPARVNALLALLALAHHAAGGTSFGDEFRRIARASKSCLLHPETHLWWHHGWFQDMLGYLTLPVIIDLEVQEEDIAADATEGLARLWARTGEQGNAFYNAMALFTLGRQAVPWKRDDQARACLDEFNTDQRGTGLPTGKVAVERVNSVRTDLPKFKYGGGLVTLQPLPVWQRPAADVFWQRNPYSLDGWQGVYEPRAYFNGMDFLLAYHLARRAGARGI